MAKQKFKREKLKKGLKMSCPKNKSGLVFEVLEIDEDKVTFEFNHRGRKVKATRKIEELENDYLID